LQKLKKKARNKQTMEFIAFFGFSMVSWYLKCHKSHHLMRFFADFFEEKVTYFCSAFENIGLKYERELFFAC
jgi:hypothetical protein